MTTYLVVSVAWRPFSHSPSLICLQEELDKINSLDKKINNEMANLRVGLALWLPHFCFVNARNAVLRTHLAITSSLRAVSPLSLPLPSVQEKIQLMLEEQDTFKSPEELQVLVGVESPRSLVALPLRPRL